MTKKCRDCGEEYKPTPHQLRKSDYICRDCRSTYDKQWRKRRKEEGRPVVSGKMPPDYHRAYQAEWRERPGVRAKLSEHARRRMQNPIVRKKAQVRRVARTAIETGVLQRQACEVCGEPKTDAHHDDYALPLEVRWLCRQHHMDVHNKAEGREDHHA